MIPLEWELKSFSELTADELYDILRLRVDVFVVEQRCPYHEIDGADRDSLHLFARVDGALKAYLRLCPMEGEPGTVRIGRVVTADRGVGLGGELLRRGIEAAFETMGANEIFLEAQEYAAGFYEREGFVRCSEVFPEDGIPHVQMRLKKNADR